MNPNDLEELGKNAMAVGCGIWAFFIFAACIFVMLGLLFG